MPKRTMVGGAENIDLKVEIDCDLDDASLNEFLINATYASPLNGLTLGQLESLFKLGKNDTELPTAKVAELSGSLFTDPGNHFAKAQPQPDDLVLMSPVGPTLKKDVVMGTASGGSSLSDKQDRRLNIGAVAVMREDGIKEIQQMQYSPFGTSFKFLSSEDGRAPDANTLMSAGIGFCFMTQFGRFVSMLKLDLPDCRIVQACVSRLRPVVLAAGTTILGMIPLLSDAFFVSMAVTIMGGLPFASVLTLIAAPVFYRLFFGLKRRQTAS